MSDEKLYRVILSGIVRAEQSRAEVIEKLAALFHSQPEKMEQLLQGKETILTKSYSHVDAEKICAAILDAGAECRMEEILEEVSSLSDADDDAGSDGDSCSDADDDSYSDDTDEDEAEPQYQNPNQPKIHPALAKFVATNIAYYARQFAKFGDLENPKFAFTWHWPALFGFLPWALYRKLWSWAAIYFAVGTAMTLWLDTGYHSFLWIFVWPLTANYLYFRHARNRIIASREVDDAAVTGGGVSRGAVAGGMLALFLFSVMWNEYFSDRMIARYTERVGEYADPGSRQRGDGAAIDDITNLPPDVARTVATLTFLAATFKLTASEKALNDVDLSLTLFEKITRGRNVNDAWGNEITLRRDATGDVVLISAGPDGVFNNADDILQFMRMRANLIP